jgi:hypothetical protein
MIIFTKHAICRMETRYKRPETKSRKPECTTDVSHQVVRNEEYDSYMCVTCGIWVEPKCDDKDCEFCSRRPATCYPSFEGEK